MSELILIFTGCCSWQLIHLQWFDAFSWVTFNRPFSRWTCVSRCLLKQRIMEVVVTTGAINRAKLQSNHHHQQTNTQLFTGRRPFLLPNQQCQIKALKGIILHPMDLLTPSSPGVFQLCLWPLTAPGYLGGGLPCLSSAFWCVYPM